MKKALKISSCIVVLISLCIAYLSRQLLCEKDMPDLPRDEYWGPGKPSLISDDTIRPFRIEFTDEMVSDLRTRLDNTRFVDSYEDIGFEYGFNNKALRPIVNFWARNYDFGAREAFLNKFPQYKTNIQGLDIHFIRVKPENTKKRVLPLLLLHGWPGSVREFYKLIPMLMSVDDEYDFTFELIIPSLPGFGFSQAPSRPGLSASKIGFIMSKLMKRLGHDKYYIQGGDWGSIICSSMATFLQDEVLGYHSNFPMLNTPLITIKMLIGSIWPTMFMDEKYVNRVYPLKKRYLGILQESGYLHIQATKPDSVGVGLDDSPAGLVAWLLEKFSGGTNPEYIKLADGGLTKKFTFEELIDNIMFYWVSKSATTAARIYAENFNKANLALNIDAVVTNVPTAFARFPHEIIFLTEWQLKEKFVNLVHISDPAEGGHFAALEVPKVLAKDIKVAFQKFLEFNSTK